MKVSIIVAAYNIEEYIDRCIESLKNQTFKDIEIIIINDGSTDNTLEKIKNEIKNDNRILLINQKNKGLMTARWNGYKKATGDYILFVDGDDWLRKDAIEKLSNKAIKDNSDIICYKFIYIDDNGIERKSHINNDFITFDIIKNNEFLKGIMKSTIIPSAWSKFISKAFIDKNNIELDNDLKYAEDIMMSALIGMYNPKVSMLNEYLYYYYQRVGSITKSLDDRILDIEKSVRLVGNELMKRDLYDELREEYEYLSFLQNYFNRLNIILKFDNKYSKLIYNNWKRYNINIYNNRYINKKVSKQGIGYRIIIMLLNYNYNLGKFYFRLRNLIV